MLQEFSIHDMALDLMMHPSSKHSNTDSSINKPLCKRLRLDGTPRGSHGGVRIGSGQKPKAATTLTVAAPAGPSIPADKHIQQ